MPLPTRMICALMLAALGASAGGPVAAQTASDAAAMGFLVQKVCIDGSDRPLAIDPYDCPANHALRSLRVGESLPYRKHDQPRPGHLDGLQRHDSYPVRDVAGNALVVINPFDYEPYDHFKPWAGGYDVFRVQDGWASVGETRDVAGYSTTFFGANCTPYNGWVFFPTTIFDSAAVQPGSVTQPIKAVYWEHDGSPWPAPCPDRYQTNSLTSWELLKAFPFGGVSPNPVKRLDTIRSIHGFTPNPQFLVHGHLEVFYFTKLYGVTRWEVWTPSERVAEDAQLRQKADETAKICLGARSQTYEGHDFTVTACRDWSAVTVSDPPMPPPAWPIPDLNLLRNFHFASGLAGWTGAKSAGKDETPSWTLKNSTTERDLRFAQPGAQGVRYLAGDCTGKCSAAEALYQDVPLSPSIASGTFTFGAIARSLEGVTLRFSLAQLDSSGAVLSEKSFEATAQPGSDRFSPEESVVLSSSFLSTSLPIAIEPNASQLRFALAPTKAGHFDVVSAWLMRDY